eukprot:12422-Heterococcus_DN1.PRE.1
MQLSSAAHLNGSMLTAAATEQHTGACCAQLMCCTHRHFKINLHLREQFPCLRCHVANCASQILLGENNKLTVERVQFSQVQCETFNGFSARALRSSSSRLPAAVGCQQQ